MILEPAKLLIVVAGSLLLGGGAFLGAKGWPQRLMLIGLLGGLFFYSGIGSAETRVSAKFLTFYFVFFIAVILGFFVALRIFRPLSVLAGRRLPQALQGFQRHNYWTIAIGTYVSLSLLLLLVWPDFKVWRLLAPPIPDLTTRFAERFVAETPHPLVRILEYARLLLTPFFYAGLYFLRNRMRWSILLVGGLLYAQYVSHASIGRGYLMINLGFLFVMAWLLYPQWRRRLAVLGAAAVLPVFYLLYWYSVVRIGGAVGEVGVAEAMMATLFAETSLVGDTAMPLYLSGERANLWMYLVWIVTLPWPKALVGAIEGARINYEISEIVLGLSIGSPGWYVVLPGLVGESLYLYGPHFFWIHGLFIGVLAALMVRLMEQVPQLATLLIYTVMLFAYIANRGGVAGLLPSIVNGFLLFYLIMGWLLLRRNSSMGKMANKKVNLAQEGTM